MPPKTYSLHIGVSTVNQQHYLGLLTDLPCCIADATKMNDIALGLQYDKSRLLIDGDATTANIFDTLNEYSNIAQPGDLVLISYSGHGGLIEDIDFDEEDSPYDQTWCLYDRQLIDDELRVFWKKFRKGVNIFVLLDSCHSGSAVKAVASNIKENLDKVIDSFFEEQFFLSKAVKQKDVGPIYLENRVLYDNIINNTEKVSEEEIEAAILLISACQDNQTARAGSTLSYFTRLLLEVLKDDLLTDQYFTDHYRFYELLKLNSISTQTPNFLYVNSDSDYFKNVKPFLKEREQKYPQAFSSIVNANQVAKSEKGLESGAGLILEVDDKDIKAVQEILGKQELTHLSAKVKSEEVTKDYFLSMPVTKGHDETWDMAYQQFENLAKQGRFVLVEPDFELDKESDIVNHLKSVPSNDYLETWPAPRGIKDAFIWHLLPEYSQLRDARDEIMKLPEEQRRIRIAHIDTGYAPAHPALKNINVTAPVSFVPGEGSNPAYDKINRGSIAEQDYHGTGTLSLLAGGYVDEQFSFDGFKGLVGAIPFAEIVPIRIADTVALTGLLNNTKRFTKAIYHAIDQKCEVITMSMGGAPARSWARAINDAYEAGITVVTAAGNHWSKGLGKLAPKRILFPARFDRVIAAAGVCENHEPYNFDANSFGKIKGASEYQQGNYLPPSAMKTAIAAYTPNITWAMDSTDNPFKFRKSGGGTSSAAPQVAAAAALWIIKNREQLKPYEGSWRKVEAVRYALKEKANRDYVLSERYYGWGILKAFDALGVGVPQESKLKKAPKAKVSLWGLAEFVKLVVLRKTTEPSREEIAYGEKLSEMVALEISQILHKDPNLFYLAEAFDAEDEMPIKSQEQFLNLLQKVKRSFLASKYLREL